MKFFERYSLFGLELNDTVKQSIDFAIQGFSVHFLDECLGSLHLEPGMYEWFSRVHALGCSKGVYLRDSKDGTIAHISLIQQSPGPYDVIYSTVHPSEPDSTSIGPSYTLPLYRGRGLFPAVVGFCINSLNSRYLFSSCRTRNTASARSLSRRLCFVTHIYRLQIARLDITISKYGIHFFLR